MGPGLRKWNLTAHVSASVDWLGAVAAFLVLSIAGLTSRDADIVRGAYLAMNLIGQLIIVPLSLAAFLTGLMQSLGTPWGESHWARPGAKLGLHGGDASRARTSRASTGSAADVSSACKP